MMHMMMNVVYLMNDQRGRYAEDRHQTVQYYDKPIQLPDLLVMPVHTYTYTYDMI